MSAGLELVGYRRSRSSSFSLDEQEERAVKKRKCRESFSSETRSQTLEEKNFAAQKIQTFWKRFKERKEIQDKMIFPSQIEDFDAFERILECKISPADRQNLHAAFIVICREVNEKILKNDLTTPIEIDINTNVFHESLAPGYELKYHLVAKINKETKQVEMVIDTQKKIAEGGYKKVFVAKTFLIPLELINKKRKVEILSSVYKEITRKKEISTVIKGWQFQSSFLLMVPAFLRKHIAPLARIMIFSPDRLILEEPFLAGTMHQFNFVDGKGKKHTIALTDILKGFSKLVDVLKLMNSFGINHSDVKPENIMWDIDENGEIIVKLCDFDIVAKIGRSGVSNPWYAERIVGKYNFETPFTDIFALVLSIGTLFLGRKFIEFLQDHDKISTDKFKDFIDVVIDKYCRAHPGSLEKNKIFTEKIIQIRDLIIRANDDSERNQAKLVIDRPFREKLMRGEYHDPEVVAFYDTLVTYDEVKKLMDDFLAVCSS